MLFVDCGVLFVVCCLVLVVDCSVSVVCCVSLCVVVWCAMDAGWW